MPPTPGNAREVVPALGANGPAGKAEPPPVLFAANLRALDVLHLHEIRSVYDRWHAALNPHAAEIVNARVPFVGEQLPDHVVAARPAHSAAHAPLGEIVGDALVRLAQHPSAERFPDERRLLFVDFILACVVYVVTEHVHAVGHALQGVAFHSPFGANGNLLGFDRSQPFVYLLHQDALGAVGKGLHRGVDLNARLLQLALVYGSVVLVAAEPVHHVDQNDVRFARVGYHALELWAFVRFA